jgi:hypothetical protein
MLPAAVTGSSWLRKLCDQITSTCQFPHLPSSTGESRTSQWLLDMLLSQSPNW